MDIVAEHIETRLNTFLNNNTINFEDVFSKITGKSKDDFRQLVKYIDLIIENDVSVKEELGYIHIHVRGRSSNELKVLILEYLTIKFFEINLTESSVTEDQDYLENLVYSLKSKCNRLETCPQDAKGVNGGNRIFRNWINAKKGAKSKLVFYQELLDKQIDLRGTTVINTLKKYKDEFARTFSDNPFGVQIEDYQKQKTFVVLNTTQNLNKIDEIEGLVDHLNYVVLFDGESKSDFLDFNLKKLKDWNDADADFRKLLVFTFDSKKNNLQSLKNTIELVGFRFKGVKENTYVINENEYAERDYKTKLDKVHVTFYGIEDNAAWERYYLETRLDDSLYELGSLKMRNIYSLALNEMLKQEILSSIFNDKEGMVSSETKLSIPDDIRGSLKENLSTVLDYIISSGWKDHLTKLVDSYSFVVVPDFINSNSLFKKELAKELDVRENKILTWSSLMKKKAENIFFLTYNDRGNYNNYFYPNIIEYESAGSFATYLNFFFKRKYEWAIYEYNKDYYDLLEHKIRHEFFNWKELDGVLKKLRPSMKPRTNWDIESSYVSKESRESVKLKLKGENRAKTYFLSELFICKNEGTYRVYRAKKLLNFDQSKIEIQCLDDISSIIPIYDTLADVNQQELQLSAIKKKFKLGEDEVAGRLWKILLKRKSDQVGQDKLYSILSDLLGKEGREMVSYQHFITNWLNPDSDSVSPLVKTTFRVVCDYLELPRVYISLIQRMKNKIKQTSRGNTRKMNELFKDLFNDKCLDDISKIEHILNDKIQFYYSNHSLEEMGIDEDHLFENLKALVELINDEIKVSKIDKIEIIST